MGFLDIVLGVLLHIPLYKGDEWSFVEIAFDFVDF
jgi:hypothetical protein